MSSNLKKLSFSTVIPLLIILTLLSMGILMPILSTIIFGAILAYYVRFIARKIKPYVKYDTLSIFLGIIVLIIPVVLLLYFTFNQFISIAGSFFGSLQQVTTSNSTINMTQINEAVQNLSSLTNISENVVNTLQSGITQVISYLTRQIISLISSIPVFAAQIFILLFSTFYFARDGDKVIAYVKDVVPDKDKDFYQQVFDSADEVLKSIIVGNVIPAAILGVLSGILYYFLGYPYVILLAIITAVTEFIPIIGPQIVYGVIGILSIITGNTLQGVLVILFGWIIQTTTDFYIRPKISVRYSKVHPLIFLLGFIYGVVTMGIPGLFIGPLILGITYAAYKIYREEKLKKKTHQIHEP